MRGITNATDNNDRKSSDANADTNSQVPSLHHNTSKPSSELQPLDDHHFKDPEVAKERSSSAMAEENTQEVVKLPQTFAVKYLGKREAHGLWGIKHTRKPVDDMVNAAKTLKPGVTLPYIQFKVNVDGVTVSEMPQNINKDFESGFYPVDIISYGVQDLVYTRVFSMIVVRDPAASQASLALGATSPFECYAYVCDCRQNARRLTIALASAFQEFSKTVKNQKVILKRYAIDLRTPEEMAEELQDQETEA